MVSRRSFLRIGVLSAAVFGFVDKILGRSLQAESEPLKNMLADVKPLMAEDYAARREKAARLMAEHQIDGLFIEGGINLFYFANVNWWRSERTFGAVIHRKREPVWVCPVFERKRAEELIPRDQEIRTWEEDESPFRVIAGFMKDLGAASGRLAVDPSMSTFLY